MGYRTLTVSERLDRGPLWPLVEFLALAFASITVQPSGTSWPLVAAAAGVAAGLVAAAAAMPWRRLPRAAQLAPAIGTLVVLALLRHSHGGSTSGYGPLVLLPLTWVALVIGRRAVLAMSLAIGGFFAIPILVLRDPLYPGSGWRLAILWVIVANGVGLVVAAVVAAQRTQADSAAWQAAQAAQTLRALEAVAEVARDISAGADARERICEAALSGTDAAAVTLTERSGDGFALTGAAGVPIAFDILREAVKPEATLAAFHSQERIIVPDVSTNAGVSPLLIQSTGIVSALFEPVIRRGVPVGVLAVGWSTRRETIDPETQAIISFLAAEAGSAIERCDLLARLDELARTDELTAVPNRRAWDDAVAAAVRERGTVCVGMLDIDHFKAFNDAHGHLAGDELLQRCARAWSSAMRPEDLLARYGGEEFAVLLRGTSLVAAQVALERVRRATPAAVTCSLGVAEGRPFETADELMERADSALYGAKHAGRDRLIAA